MHTDFVFDALEQAFYDRQPERDCSLICPSDRGSPSWRQNRPIELAL